MRLSGTVWTLLLLLATATSVSGQPTLKKADLGRCKLDNGGVIEECTISYRTAGTLNQSRSNVILFPTWFSGTSADLLGQLGRGGIVDTSRYHIVLVDALGNGVSASPSTSSSQPDSTFPVFTVSDMVDTQHRLLTEVLNIDSLHAVVGLSMGGMQTFAWSAQYPTFMNKAVPLTGTPRLTPQDMLLWRSQLRAFRSACPESEACPRAMRTIAAIHTLHLRTPQRLAAISSPEFERYIARQDSAIRQFDPHDWASQLRAMLQHDVTKQFDGSLEATSSAIQAEMLVVTVEQDHMVNPIPAQRFADIRNAEELVLRTDCGHLGLGCKKETVASTVRHFLRDR